MVKILAAVMLGLFVLFAIVILLAIVAMRDVQLEDQDHHAID